MSTYEVSTYGWDGHGHPIGGTQTIEAATPADALSELGWTVERARFFGEVTVAYRTCWPADLGDVMVERAAGDLPCGWYPLSREFIQRGSPS